MPVARAETEEAVANLALDLLREPPIASLNDTGSKAARACRRWFGTARDEVLREKHWNFATDWAQPAMDPTPSLGPLPNRFAVPADWVQVRFVQGVADCGWALEQGFLVSGAGSVLVCGTKRITDIAQWDMIAVLALAHRLAGYIAPSFGKTASDVTALDEKAEDKLTVAAQRGAREHAAEQLPRHTSWTVAQFGGRRP